MMMMMMIIIINIMLPFLISHSCLYLLACVQPCDFILIVLDRSVAFLTISISDVTYKSMQNSKHT